MSKRWILAGATDQTIDVNIGDSSSTVGDGLTGLVFNSASLVCYYRKGATGAATALTLATQTVGGAHSDGGFVEISSANMPGVYRLDLSDTMVATAGMLTIQLKGATNMMQTTIEIEVVSVNIFDAVRMGLTALPNAAAEAAGGLYTRGTGAGQINQDANGRIDTNIAAISGDGVAADNAEAFFDGNGYAGTGNTIPTVSTVTGSVGSVAGNVVGNVQGNVAGNVSGNVTGSVGSVAGLQAEIDDIQARLPAALVSGRMDSSVGAMAAGVVTAAAVATDAIDADALAADAVAEIQSGLATGASLATVAAGVVAIEVDTQDIQTRLPAALTGAGNIKADALVITANGSTLSAIPWNAAWDAEVQSEVTDALVAYDPPTQAEMLALLTTAVTESYAANGAAPTVVQALCQILSLLANKQIVGTVLTAYKLDGVTAAGTYDLDSGTTPTEIFRAT